MWASRSTHYTKWLLARELPAPRMGRSGAASLVADLDDFLALTWSSASQSPKI
jgi:hypothetical protein